MVFGGGQQWGTQGTENLGPSQEIIKTPASAPREILMEMRRFCPSSVGTDMWQREKQEGGNCNHQGQPFLASPYACHPPQSTAPRPCFGLVLPPGPLGGWMGFTQLSAQECIPRGLNPMGYPNSPTTVTGSGRNVRPNLSQVR